MPDDGIMSPNMDPNQNEKLSTIELIQELKDAAELKNEDLKFGMLEDLAADIEAGNVEIDKTTRKAVRSAIDEILGDIDEEKLSDKRKATVTKLRDSVQGLIEKAIAPDDLAEMLQLLIKTPPRYLSSKAKRITAAIKGKQILMGEKDDRRAIRSVDVMIERLGEKHSNNTDVMELCNALADMFDEIAGVEIDGQDIDKKIKEIEKLIDGKEASAIHKAVKALTNEMEAKPTEFGIALNWDHVESLEKLSVIVEIKFSNATGLHKDLQTLMATALAAKGFSTRKKAEPKGQFTPPQEAWDVLNAVDKIDDLDDKIKHMKKVVKEFPEFKTAAKKLEELNNQKTRKPTPPSKPTNRIEDRLKTLIKANKTEVDKRVHKAIKRLDEQARLLYKAGKSKGEIKVPGRLLMSAGWDSIEEIDYTVDAEKLVKEVNKSKVIERALTARSKTKSKDQRRPALLTTILKAKVIAKGRGKNRKGWFDDDLDKEQQKIINAEREIANRMATAASDAILDHFSKKTKPDAHTAPVPDIDDALALASHHPDVQDAKNARHRAKKAAAQAATKANGGRKPKASDPSVAHSSPVPAVDPGDIPNPTPTPPPLPDLGPTDATVAHVAKKPNGVNEEQKILDVINAKIDLVESLDKLEVIRQGFSDESAERYRQSGTPPNGFKNKLDPYLKAQAKLKSKTSDPLNAEDRKKMALRFGKQAQASHPDEWEQELENLVRKRLAAYSRKFLQ